MKRIKNAPTPAPRRVAAVAVSFLAFCLFGAALLTFLLFAPPEADRSNASTALTADVIFCATGFFLFGAGAVLMAGGRGARTGRRGRSRRLLLFADLIGMAALVLLAVLTWVTVAPAV